MELREFERYISQGLGRAVIMLQREKDKKPFRDAVIYLATHDTRYDRQCDPYKGQYISELIECFEDKDQIYAEIFEKYLSTEETDDRAYFATCLSDMAKHGNAAAIDILRQIYNHLAEQIKADPHPQDDPDTPIDYLLFDYTHCAELLLDLWTEDDETDIQTVDSSKKAEIWESVLKDNLQLMLAGDRFDVSDATVLWSVVLNDSGVELFRSIATHLADQSEDYGRMLESFHASWQRQKERRVELRTPRNKSGEALPPPKTLEQFMETMPTLSPLAWKKYAVDFLNSSGDNSERIAELLEKPISEASRKSILYLMLVDSKHFSGESYPRDPQPLIDELNKYAPQNTPIDTQEKRFARDLSKLISRIRHPAVREHALRRIELKKTLSYSSAIDIFTVYTFLMNYDESNAEDEALLMSLIKDEEDEFTAHSNGMDLIELSRDFPDGTHVPEPLMNHLMLFIYESTPCPNCKARAASYLMSENNRSFSRENKLELAREMIHDSVGTLRAIAGSFLS